jgi:hypothetical protein
MTIKLSTANVLHALMVLLQVLNLVSGAVPPKYQPFVAAGIAGIQMLIGKLQHNSMPPVAHS